MSECRGKANQRRALRFLETVLLILWRLKLSETRACLRAPLCLLFAAVRGNSLVGCG